MRLRSLVRLKSGDYVTSFIGCVLLKEACMVVVAVKVEKGGRNNVGDAY